jgi:hypothetical protein
MSLATIVDTIRKGFTNAFAHRSTTIQEDLFIQGVSYTARDVITVPPTATNDMYIHFVPDPTCQTVFAPLGFTAAGAGPVVITYYANPTLTAGGRTDIEESNRRQDLDPVPTSNATIELVAHGNVSAPGTKFAAQLVASSGSVGAIPGVGATAASGLPFVINPNVDYLLKLENTNGDPVSLEYNIDWFEIPIG